MMSCKEAAAASSAEMDRPLGLGEQLSLRTHLMMCRGCTNYHRQLRTLRQVMQAYADGRASGDDPPAGKDR